MENMVFDPPHTLGPLVSLGISGLFVPFGLSFGRKEKKVQKETKGDIPRKNQLGPMSMGVVGDQWSLRLSNRCND